MSEYPSTVALLHRLKSAGVATALVTASRNSGTALATAGVNELFAVVVDGADAASLHLAGKPAPDMFLEAARQLGVQPEQAVVIEDAAAGVRAAVAGRFGRVIGIDRGGNQARLQAAGADLVVTDLAGANVTASALDSTPWCGGADLAAGPWFLAYDGYDPHTEGIRKTLCTLANGYWGSRGAASHAPAGPSGRWPGWCASRPGSSSATTAPTAPDVAGNILPLRGSRSPSPFRTATTASRCCSCAATRRSRPPRPSR